MSYAPLFPAILIFLALVFLFHRFFFGWHFGFGLFSIFFSPAGNKYFIRRGVKGVQNLHQCQVSLGPA